MSPYPSDAPDRGKFELSAARTFKLRDEEGLLKGRAAQLERFRSCGVKFRDEQQWHFDFSSTRLSKTPKFHFSCAIEWQALASSVERPGSWPDLNARAADNRFRV